MDAVEDVKNRLAIEDVVGEYIQLKRAGRNFKGLSPFTNEKTPSFIVSPEKQIWHDFSSGRGGNVFSFVMEVEGLDFKGALELLARKAGVDLEKYGNRRGPSGKTKERLYEVLEKATHFYQIQLTKNSSALKYVRQQRGFSKQTILEFRLGYSPNSGDALSKFLLAKGFSADELKKAGLSTQRANGFSDMFRGRLMVPLADPQGRVVGFTARLLADDPNAPKYINTPATTLYDKSRHIYGLNLAKETIRKSNFVVVAEGNLDVIASHQAGVRQVVATAGTAMTAQQFNQLKRFSGDVRLAFDADRAGQSAAERAIPLAQAAGVSLSIVSIKGGKDPDELIRQDVKLWQQAIGKPEYVVDWLIKRYQTEVDTSSGPGKKRLTDVVLAVVRKLQDPVEQDHYLQKLAKLIGISHDSLKTKLAHDSGAKKYLKNIKTDRQMPQPNELDKLTQHFLGIMLFYPSLRDLLPPIPELLFSGDSLALRKFIVQNPDFSGDPAKAKELREVADYVKMLALLTEEAYQKTDRAELRYQTESLRARLVGEYVKTKKLQISQNLTNLDGQSADKLMAEAKALDDLHRQFVNR